jgi:hypothetical protein
MWFVFYIYGIVCSFEQKKGFWDSLSWPLVVLEEVIIWTNKRQKEK